MEEEIYKKYKKAGEIAANARNYGVKLIRPEVSYLKVAEEVEKRITNLGGGLAFPVNISINDAAAHFTPSHRDKGMFKEGDVVKLDVGAHVDGYIADTAVTTEIESDRYTDIVEASKEALSNVIDAIKPGIKLKEIGKIISTIIDKKGFKPIENLSGHSLQRYTLHAGLSIPNVPEVGNKSLKEGDAVAIEPFASSGAGYVVSRGISNIYMYIRPPIMRDVKARILARRIKNEFKTLPFAERWCIKYVPDVDNTLQKLVNNGSIHSYQMLFDKDGGIVSQHEHTIIVTSDGCEVTT